MSEWRVIGDAGAYPDWLRALKGKHGVYAIRERARSTLFGLVAVPALVVYVGESHTKRLYETLTRHFQQWRRQKAWWRGKYSAEQADPGHTYQRKNVEVMVKVAPSRAVALAWQAAWIRRLKPRDNRIGAELEAAPF